jgi:tRNA(Leu) C34 or U34 (ribose-2'-O)-methylase TrmL
MRYGDNLFKNKFQILIFGFEDEGIPINIRKLSHKFIQLDARKSLNLVATVSIFMQELLK